MNYFENVSGLVQEDKLRLIVIIAPPRTGSTMLETMLSKSHDIDLEVNEPFVNYGHFGDEPLDGYEKIYSEACRVLAHQQTVTMLVKEMSHWINLRNEYQKLFSLTDNIVLSIRNPLLSTESRIKKFVEPLTIKPRPIIQAWLSNYVAVKSGFNSWSEMEQARSRVAVEEVGNKLYGLLQEGQDQPSQT